MKDKKVTAIILVAGNSTRYGQNKNKNLELLNNKTILEYSLDKFNKNPNITDIIITCKKDELEFINRIIYKSRSLKPIKTVIGGNSRKESVFNSINSTDSDIVIIHDGARPMIKDSYINNSITEMNNYKGGNGGNGFGRLEFKKDNKNYKFKGDKRMEAFMKEFNIDSLALKNANRKYKNNYD